jgi:hypothetical protein
MHIAEILYTSTYFKVAWRNLLSVRQNMDVCETSLLCKQRCILDETALVAVMYIMYYVMHYIYAKIRMEVDIRGLLL